MSMSTTLSSGAAAAGNVPEKRRASLFELRSNFFESCRLLPSPRAALVASLSHHLDSVQLASSTENQAENEGGESCFTSKSDAALSRWTCNTCKAEFESLQDQRAHFKSDIHLINVKLSLAGKEIVKEDDFDEATLDSFNDYDISSISGSEDEADKGSATQNDLNRKLIDVVKQKIFVLLQTGERVSIWKSLLLNESEDILYENHTSSSIDNYGIAKPLQETEVIEKLTDLIHEPRDKTHLRVLLLASGGHFAGCVFDGNTVVAHKTFHRYVVRAKSGKKQSLKDAGGRFAHSAGASLRRYNELSLKKDIQDLLAGWKPYFDASSCVFIYAPSNNRQLLFTGEKPNFSHSTCAIRSIPLTVRRPTFKEAKRLYNLLTEVTYEKYEEEIPSASQAESPPTTSVVIGGDHNTVEEEIGARADPGDIKETCLSSQKSEEMVSSDNEENGTRGSSTPLHEASISGSPSLVLELLEQGMDPCAKDERGRTPYTLANDKEVRNTFRRFMASNLEKWDWNAAKVPSPLTKEMEESQAAKQAEKDAKRKARAKELKKLRREKEKKAQAEAAAAEKAAAASARGASSSAKGGSQSRMKIPQMSKEESMRAAQAAEREKRAAAAERRMAAAISAQSQGSSGSTAPSNNARSGTEAPNCSFCSDSLSGKVPFHRYSYKYCSTTCMHLHSEVLED